MKPERWKKISEILKKVLEKPVSEQTTYLKEKCGADTELLSEIKSLLVFESVGQAKQFKNFEDNVFGFISDYKDSSANDAFIDRQIGNYRIKQILGAGGMGVVFLAERVGGEFEQKVALKLIRQTFINPQLENRFRRERQILASLNHANIAKLIDGGVSDMGELFLAMEYIEGEPLLEFAERQNLDVKQRLHLFLKICSAVQYAHLHLTIHRDIKPGNVLVTEDSEPKLLDFGLAKILNESLFDEAQTEPAFRALTPAYASPEQIHGKNITTASDVYSLGVCLYELLTGNRPFDFDNKSFEEIIRLIDTNAPPKPSTAVSSQQSAISRKGIDKNKDLHGKTETQNPKFLSGDLDNIVLMALRKEPERRYQAVEQLAQDIRRHLEGLPVSARPQTFSYLAAKFIQRNKTAVFAASFVFLALLAGLAIALWQAQIARAEKDRAERRFNDVRRLSNSLLFELSPKIERLPGSTEAREILVERALEYLDSLAKESQNDRALQSELAAAYEKIGDLQGNPANPNLIDNEKAVENYEKARKIRLKLLERNPSDAEQQTRLAENYRIAGKIYGQANNLEAELKNLEKAREIYGKLLLRQPQSESLQFALAQTNFDIGKNYSNQKSYVDSFPYYKKVINSTEKLLQKNPNKSDWIKLLGDSLSQYGLGLSWEGKQKEAEQQMARAVEILEPAVARSPNDTDLSIGLWLTYWLTSMVYEEQNNPLSHEFALKAVKVIEDASEKDKADIRAKQQLAKSLSHAGQTSFNIGKPAEAISFLKKADEILRQITETRAKNDGLKVEIAINLMRMGGVKSDQKAFAEALLDLDEAVKIHLNILQNSGGSDKRSFRNLAVTYDMIAETHEKLAQEGKKTEIHRQMAKDHYQKVLDILQKLDAQKLLAEFDRKFLEATKSNLLKYEKNGK